MRPLLPPGRRRHAVVTAGACGVLVLTMGALLAGQGGTRIDGVVERVLRVR